MLYSYGNQNFMVLVKEIDRWSGIENPEVALYKYSQLVFGKGVKSLNGRKIIFSTNGDGAIRHPFTKNLDLSLTCYTDLT